MLDVKLVGNWVALTAVEMVAMMVAMMESLKVVRKAV